MAKHIHIHLASKKTGDRKVKDAGAFVSSKEIEQELVRRKKALETAKRNGVSTTVIQGQIAEAEEELKKARARETKDADWSARHVGNFRFEVTSPQGKKISIARAETSAEAIEKAKKLPAGVTHDGNWKADWIKRIDENQALWKVKTPSGKIVEVRASTSGMAIREAKAQTGDDATHDFQPNFTARGRNYVSTGKTRKAASGEMEAEYEELGANKERTGRFLWIAANGMAKNDSARDAQKPYLSLNEKYQEWEVLNSKNQVAKTFPKSQRAEAQKYLRDNFEKLQNGYTADATETQDSEENDAYIKGHQDGIEGKRQDPAFHPGGDKKAAVALKYAEGYRQGEKDRKAGKTGDAGEKYYVKNMSGQVVKTCSSKFEADKYVSEHQSERLHVYTTAGQKDSTFSGTERQWKDAISAKHPGAVFRARAVGTLSARDAKNQEVGTYSTVKKEGSVRE